MKHQKYLPITAAIILIVAIAATLYVNSAKVDSTEITINGNQYTIDQLFEMGEERKIETEAGETGSGAALDQIMQKIGIPDPATKQYTLIGADGYQKTVTWENLQTGIITRSRESLFSSLPKAFYVEQIVEIKAE